MPVSFVLILFRSPFFSCEPGLSSVPFSSVDGADILGGECWCCTCFCIGRHVRQRQSRWRECSGKCSISLGLVFSPVPWPQQGWRPQACMRIYESIQTEGCAPASWEALLPLDLDKRHAPCPHCKRGWRSHDAVTVPLRPYLCDFQEHWSCLPRTWRNERKSLQLESKGQQRKRVRS
jgi:hypothetical protein